MGTSLAFGSGDPISFLFALVLGILQVGALLLIALIFLYTYWKQIVGVGCALLALHVTLQVVNAPLSPEAAYQACVAKAEKSQRILDLYTC